MTFSVTKIDRGMKDFVAAIKGGPGSLDVGVHRDKAHERDEAGGPTNADIAKWMEFGDLERGRKPRSFLRSTLSENGAVYSKMMAREFKKYIHHKQTKDQAMEHLGLRIVADIRKKIIRGIAPSLKPATLQSKRRRGLPRPHVPLFATGAMYNAIEARIAHRRVLVLQSLIAKAAK